MFLYDLVKKYNISKRLFITYFIALAVIIYFILCSIFGAKGLLTYSKLAKQAANKENAKQDLSLKMQAKENMVKGMNLDSLDLDLLDEQARKTLGYSGKNEIIIYQEKKFPKNKNQIKKDESNLNEK